MMFKFRFTELFIIALTGNGILADAGERILTTSVRTGLRMTEVIESRCDYPTSTVIAKPVTDVTGVAISKTMVAA